MHRKYVEVGRLWHAQITISDRDGDLRELTAQARALRGLQPEQPSAPDRLGGPGRLLSRGSHRPGRADFSHPVRQIMGSLSDRQSARRGEAAEEILRAAVASAPKSALLSKIVD